MSNLSSSELSYIFDIDYDEVLARSVRGRGSRVKLDSFIVSFSTTLANARTLRHAWNPKNKRAVCGAKVEESIDKPFADSERDFNCVTCQRQWDKWVEIKAKEY